VLQMSLAPAASVTRVSAVLAARPAGGTAVAGASQNTKGYVEKKTKKFQAPTEPRLGECGARTKAGSASAAKSDTKKLIDSRRIASECESGLLPAEPAGAEAKELAVSGGIQKLWGTLLPLLGVLPAKPGEYPGIFRIEPGPTDHEATIFIDIPNQPYEAGETPGMERVVTLRVKLDHDYRLLGDRYYCVDCETPTSEVCH